MSYLELVKGFRNQVIDASKIEPTSLPKGDFTKIVVAGMGGSAISGDVLANYVPDLKIPIFVNRHYELPSFVDKNTLVIVISYSGNTEEALSCFRHAKGKGGQICGITSGGKLLTKFQEGSIPHIQIPAGMQPRATLAFQFIPLIRLLDKLGILKSVASDISKTIDALKKSTYDERAKTLATKLIGKVPLVYASPYFSSVAYRWKTQFNENTKIHAFSNVIPELNHNELVGYTNPNAKYYGIILEDESDHPRVRARMKLTREIMSKKDIPSILIAVRGESRLSRIFSAIHIGDLTSVYLAMYTNTDPEPVEIIEDFKKKLPKSSMF